MSLVLGLGGCSRRGDGTINVDEVQGYVNAVEKNLRGMRTALNEKKLGEARDAFEEAEEILADNRTALSAYPEMEELESSVGEGRSSLCYHEVSLTLERMFIETRAENLGEARDQLKEAQKHFERCQPQIEKRDDFFALKMNLETAPQALTDLEAKLARPALVARMKERRDELVRQLDPVRAKLSALEAQPVQPALSAEIDSALKAWQAEFEKPVDYAKDPEWVSAAASLSAQAKELNTRWTSAMRRGKLMAVAGPLTEADRLAAGAPLAKQKQQAVESLQRALTIYRECADTAASVLAENPEAAKMKVTVKGVPRTVKWLQKHCASSAARVERMQARLSGKAPTPEKKPEAKPETKPEVKPEVKPETKPTKDPKSKKRRRRVRRWD